MRRYARDHPVGLYMNGRMTGNTQDTRVRVEVLVKGQLEDGGATVPIAASKLDLSPAVQEKTRTWK